MAGPVEFRLYARKLTLDDVKAGIQPMRDGNELYCPAMLQYRYKQRLSVAGKLETEWSDWTFVPFIKEGVTTPPPPVDAA